MDESRGRGRATTFLGHLAELRRRLIFSLLSILAGSIACFALYDPLIGFLKAPLESIPGARGEAVLFVGTVFEAFLVKFKISIAAGFVATLPIHLFSIAAFVFPGLRPRERRIVAWSLAASAALAAAGFWFGYYRIIPAMIKVLTSPSFLPGGVDYLLGFERNIVLVLGFILAVLIVFQLPLLLLILLALDVLSRKAVLRASRYVVVGIFALAAIVTPSPDMISQLMLALPLIALYFFAILIARILRLGERLGERPEGRPEGRAKGGRCSG
jgi:sec-independent protein translocase protein TatC